MLYDKDIREPLFEFLEETYGKVRFLEEQVMGQSRADIVMVVPESKSKAMQIPMCGWSGRFRIMISIMITIMLLWVQNMEPILQNMSRSTGES